MRRMLLDPAPTPKLPYHRETKKNSIIIQTTTTIVLYGHFRTVAPSPRKAPRGKQARKGKGSLATPVHAGPRASDRLLPR
jgi:hypothetical protein